MSTQAYRGVQITLLLIMVPFTAFAVSLIGNPVASPTFEVFMIDILDVFIKVGALLLTIMIFYSGYLFVTAQGKDEQIQKAKTAIKWTIVGGAIIIGSGAIAMMISATMISLA